MLADGRAYVASAWWLATFAGLVIMVTVLSINMIGDWLRYLPDSVTSADAVRLTEIRWPCRSD
jgi:peptide/nickel transport system permease protein